MAPKIKHTNLKIERRRLLLDLTTTDPAPPAIVSAFFRPVDDLSFRDRFIGFHYSLKALRRLEMISKSWIEIELETEEEEIEEETEVESKPKTNRRPTLIAPKRSFIYLSIFFLAK